MKEKFILILSILTWHIGYAQIIVPDPQPRRAVSNLDMVIQFGGQKLEILPSKRAIRQPSGQYSIVVVDTSEAINKDKLGVAYSFALASNVMFTGEISFKTRAGANASSTGALATRVKVLVPPDVYVLTANSPIELVSLVKLLQKNPSVEWVEPFIAHGRIN